MKSNNIISYLRSFRLRWGLSQQELAGLLGWNGKQAIARIERKSRLPNLKFVLGCYVLFGAAAAELFPGLFSEIEDEVMANVWDLYERLQGDPSPKNKAKIELLEAAIERAKQRRAVVPV